MTIIITGYILDLIFGDPQGYPHPVRYIGALISLMERKLYKENNRIHQLAAGVFLVLLVLAASYTITRYSIQLAYYLSPTLGFIISAILAYTVLATRCLDTESRRVYKRLVDNDLQGARKALSYIVSRDTAELTEAEVVRAAVETVGENISDGIIAPLFFLFIGGVPAAMAYKAINTMDSMVGYRNDRYEYFGKAAAYLDDVVNFIPARISVIFIGLASGFVGKKSLNAFRIALRDGRNHKSPNSGYPEAAVAGALDIQLGGTNKYFGKDVHKPTIGDATMALEKKHIIDVIKLMYAASLTGIIIFSIISYTAGVL